MKLPTGGHNPAVGKVKLSAQPRSCPVRDSAMKLPHEMMRSTQQWATMDMPDVVCLVAPVMYEKIAQVGALDSKTVFRLK